MKKYLLIIVVVAALLTTGLVVYAEADVPEWFTDMIEGRKAEIEDLVDEGSLTAEEAEAWLERMDEMEAYRMEEGFENFGGSCTDDSSRRSNRGSGCRGGSFGNPTFSR